MPFTASVCSQPAPPISGLEAGASCRRSRSISRRTVPGLILDARCRVLSCGAVAASLAPGPSAPRPLPPGAPARRTRVNGTPARACRIARRVLLLCRVPRRPFALELSPASSEHVGQRGRPRPWATVRARAWRPASSGPIAAAVYVGSRHCREPAKATNGRSTTYARLPAREVRKQLLVAF